MNLNDIRGPLSPEEYYALRDGLFSKYPRAREELLVRCQHTGNGDFAPASLWRHMGDKPLYTNKSVVAGRPYEYAWLSGLYPDWQEMAGDDWLIERDRKTHFRKEDAYKIPASEKVLRFKDQEGQEIQACDGRPSFKVPKTPNSRLYPMHRFAVWLKKNFAGEGTSSSAVSRIRNTLHENVSEDELRDSVLSLRDEIDGLWGPATILHGLMDAGFAAVKPDQHLLYTMVRLNCVENPDNELLAVLDVQKSRKALEVIDAERQKRGAKIKKRDMNNPQMELAAELLAKEKYLFKAVHAARCLASRIVPCSEAQGKAVREVDIVLMRASYESTDGLRYVDTFERRLAA